MAGRAPTRSAKKAEGLLECSSCNRTLPVSYFWKDGTKKFRGCSYSCKNCLQKARREKQKSAKYRHKVHLWAKRWRDRSPENFLKYRRAIWNWSLKSKYGITLADYDRMLAEQGGGCAICGTTAGGFRNAYTGKGRLAIDHDHNCCPKKKACGKCIRGLLCQPCNTTLGRMKDSPALLRRAADYLERHAQAKRP